MKEKNKLKIANLSSCYIKSVGFPNKAVNIIQGFECFLKEHSNGCVCFPELHSLHRETDKKNPCMLFTLIGKTTIQFVLLLMMPISV